jgi:hypothetical protein
MQNALPRSRSAILVLGAGIVFILIPGQRQLDMFKWEPLLELSPSEHQLQIFDQYEVDFGANGCTYRI